VEGLEALVEGWRVFVDGGGEKLASDEFTMRGAS